MSWSVSSSGSPASIVASLKEYSEKLDGQSKIEFDAALPHIVGLVNENFGSDAIQLTVDASGHGYAEGDEQKQRTCRININTL